MEAKHEEEIVMQLKGLRDDLKQEMQLSREANERGQIEVANFLIEYFETRRRAEELAQEKRQKQMQESMAVRGSIGSKV